ncbi:MAG TPA: hypothetical protein VKX25_12890 [Bryobacteraceae bacterium]|nr:hypothetical protein [Bryobacteraceae bacterium]
MVDGSLLPPDGKNQLPTTPGVMRRDDSPPGRYTVWAVPKKQLAAATISVAGLLSFLLWLLSYFLQLRGVVDLVASRIVLALMWAVALAGVWIITMLFPKGKRMIRAMAALVLLAGVMWLDAWAPKPKTSAGTRVAVCHIEPQARPLVASPKPSEAPDEMLLSEALLIQRGILQLSSIDNNTRRKELNSHGTHPRPDSADNAECILLQQWESDLRVPAMAIQKAILQRVPLEQRVPSETARVRLAYLHPKDVGTLLDVVEGDLARLITALERAKHLKSSELPKKRWIVSLDYERIIPAEYDDDNTELSQQFSTPDGITAEVRWIGFQSPNFFSLWVVLKASPSNYKTVRITFDDGTQLDLPASATPSGVALFPQKHDLKITAIAGMTE